MFKQMQTLINTLVPGSNVSVEFAFNGAGLQLAGGYEEALILVI